MLFQLELLKVVETEADEETGNTKQQTRENYKRTGGQI